MPELFQEEVAQVIYEHECEHELCIYQRDNKCILDTPNTDATGMCANCLLVTLDTNFLNAEKDKQLQKLKERHDKWDREDQL